MHPGRSGRSLGDRARESGVRPVGSPAGPRIADGVGSADAVPSAEAGRSPDGAGRHCWVHDPPDSPGTWPGLLVEWRQRAGAWQGRVAYTVSGPHGPALVEAWLPADRLQPR